MSSKANEVHFCSQCNNMTFLFLKESEGGDKQLIYHCKSCQHDEPTEARGQCIHTLNFTKYDKSELINQNKYITHDVSLPKIEGNENLQCTNSECISIKEKKPSSVKYIKYDYDDMNYMYICDYCGTKWKNQ